LGYATDITVEEIITLVNQERTKDGLNPLTQSSELTSAATAKGTDMFANDYWAHISPTGTTPWEFITKSGYQYTYAGENLAKSFSTAQDVVDAWMKSPSHKANILKPEYKEIGIAVLNGHLSGEETTLVVEEFGSRSGTQLAQGQPGTPPNDAAGQPAGQPNAVTKSAPVAQIPVVRGSQGNQSQVKSFFLSVTTKTVSLWLAEFLLVVLFIDSIFIWKHKTIRVSGHSLAHIAFLLALLGAMGATGIGVIL
jgi:hypothetical protein